MVQQSYRRLVSEITGVRCRMPSQGGVGKPLVFLWGLWQFRQRNEWKGGFHSI